MAAVGRSMTARARAMERAINMPSRMIAKALVDSGEPVPHKKLYERGSEWGDFQSTTHFKTVLKQMKAQKTVAVSKVRNDGKDSFFAVSLTERGMKHYGWLKDVNATQASTDVPSVA